MHNTVDTMHHSSVSLSEILVFNGIDKGVDETVKYLHQYGETYGPACEVEREDAKDFQCPQGFVRRRADVERDDNHEYRLDDVAHCSVILTGIRCGTAAATMLVIFLDLAELNVLCTWMDCCLT